MMSIQNAKFGKGLFALVDIPKNTVITSVSGRLMTFTETVALKEKEAHTLQVAIDQYILHHSNRRRPYQTVNSARSPFQTVIPTGGAAAQTVIPTFAMSD